MLEYRMYVLDKIGKIIERIDLECPDDMEAVAGGKSYARNHDVEIWCGKRAVTVLNRLS